MRSLQLIFIFYSKITLKQKVNKKSSTMRKNNSDSRGDQKYLVVIFYDSTEQRFEPLILHY